MGRRLPLCESTSPSGTKEGDWSIEAGASEAIVSNSLPCFRSFRRCCCNLRFLWRYFLCSRCCTVVSWFSGVEVRWFTSSSTSMIEVLDDRSEIDTMMRNQTIFSWIKKPTNAFDILMNKFKSIKSDDESFSARSLSLRNSRRRINDKHWSWRFLPDE